ncbi:MAG: glycosyltransferase [Chitinivibrionales bacterium]|nr:glycosyltransferase [Chitinivibrionales bacterium]MBD3394923.1 glycosyltransferase [Chitinivibrionales bacterium]
MKFLLISPFTSISGSAVRFWNIAQHIRRQGHTVVYVERRPAGAPAPRLEGVVYRTSPALNNLALDMIVSLAFNMLVFLRHIDCGVYYALKPAPNNCFPALFARLLFKRTVLDIDDLDFGYLKPGIGRWLSRYFFHHLPRAFHLVTCHTPRLKEYVTANIGVPGNKVLFLTQGLSDVFVPCDPARKPEDITKSIVYLATLGITSDFDDLLVMFERLCRAHDDLHIKVIGDGVRRKYFEDRIAELGISGNVHFLGRIDHHLIPVVMAHNWIGLNYMRPTITNNCRAILKLREYLAVGLQVVCNDAGDAYLFKDHVYVEQTIDDMERRTLDLLGRGLRVNLEGRRFIEEHFRWEPGIAELLDRIGKRRT